MPAISFHHLLYLTFPQVSQGKLGQRGTQALLSCPGGRDGDTPGSGEAAPNPARRCSHGAPLPPLPYLQRHTARLWGAHLWVHTDSEPTLTCACVCKPTLHSRVKTMFFTQTSTCSPSL